MLLVPSPQIVASNLLRVDPAQLNAEDLDDHCKTMQRIKNELDELLGEGQLRCNETFNVRYLRNQLSRHALLVDAALWTVLAKQAHRSEASRRRRSTGQRTLKPSTVADA